MASVFSIEVPPTAYGSAREKAPLLRHQSSAASLAPPSATSSNFSTLRSSVTTLVGDIGYDLEEVKGHDNHSVHDLLQGLRLDEVVTLSKSNRAAHRAAQDDSLPASFINPLKRYIEYLYETWYNIFVITRHWELRELCSSTTTFV